jgi:Fe-S cluster assembly protein SufB
MTTSQNQDDIQAFGDISRATLDGSDTVVYSQMAKVWLDESVVRQISLSNEEPAWMLEHRLKALEKYRTFIKPTWWPSLESLDLESIYYFAKAEGWGDSKSWDEVPDAIKKTFDRLGIPEAERKVLAWVGAQYDSEVVYHSLRQELQDQGVIFEDMSVAIHKYESIVKQHFMKVVPITDHMFAALHGAVWSGGTFLYIPKWVKITDPLQAYFRMNVKAGGQFEHTLIVVEDDAEAHYIEWCSAPKYGTSSLHAGCVEIYVGKHAKMRYSSVENWSVDTYNLNTKRAIVEEGGSIEWVGGNLWSGVTMLYPCSILKWDDSKALHFGIAFANAWQNTDTGAKVIHIGKNTSSEVISKSLSKRGGISTYRGLLDIKKICYWCGTAKIDCDGLILDNQFSVRYDPWYPSCYRWCSRCTWGKCRKDQWRCPLFYLQSHGIPEDEAKTLIVRVIRLSTDEGASSRICCRDEYPHRDGDGGPLKIFTSLNFLFLKYF